MNVPVSSLPSLRLLAAIFLLLLVPRPAKAQDKLLTVDVVTSTITVEQKGALGAFRIKPFTDITVNGAKATINELRTGMLVTVTLADPQTASRIVARGAPALAVPNQTRPFFDRDNPAHRIRIKMKIDGHERIRYREGKLWIEHLSAAKPTQITINGVEWKPNWKGDITDPFTKFNVQPSAIGQGGVTLEQTAGREKAVLENPVQGGRFDYIPTIDVSDAPGGDDTYEFILRW